MRLPIPGGIGGRGGIGGVLLLIALFVLAQCTGIDLLGGGGAGTGGGQAGKISQLTYDSCETGADANESQDCARVAVENSLTDYWTSRDLQGWRPVEGLYTFSGSVDTGCGGATSQVGPFYCPADESIYLDTTFFDQVLEQQLGGPDGGFVEFYVLAHEYGHHISNILGFMGQVRTQEGQDSDAVKLELQADCYAGMWAQGATTTEDENGEVLVEEITEDDITLAIEAAESVGDDRIQEKTQGQVNPEVWTHGSAEMRKKWFLHGFQQANGDPAMCDTWKLWNQV